MRMFGFLVFFGMALLAVVGIGTIVGATTAPTWAPTISPPTSVPTLRTEGPRPTTPVERDRLALAAGARDTTDGGDPMTFSVSLGMGEAVVGQSYGFGGRDTGCRAWLVSGPFAGEVTVTDGEWFTFLGDRLTTAQQEALLQQVIAKQMGQGYGCDLDSIQIDRLGGNR
jgi:hypothetical protein